MMELRNRVTEKDLRDYLDTQGYSGNSAKFESLELVAVERPGWVQVFEFKVRVTDNRGRRREFFGVVRDDERRAMKVSLSVSEDERDAVVEAWSDGLITIRRTAPTAFGLVLLALFLVVLGFCGFSALVGNQ